MCIIKRSSCESTLTVFQTYVDPQPTELGGQIFWPKLREPIYKTMQRKEWPDRK